jgi:hypothetical protein
METRISLRTMICFVCLLGISSAGFFSRAQWQIETVDNSNEVQQYCSIALDSTGTPHIAYQSDVDRGLYFARKVSAEWITQRIHPWSVIGYHCSLAFNSSDQPAIAHQQDYDDIIRYSFLDGSEWQMEIVDDTASVGSSVSLVFDGADRPHVAYTNFSINDLRYAYKYAGLWTIQELGVPGYSADLVLSTAGGYPHLCSMWPITYQRSNLYYTSNIASGWESETVLDTGGPGQSANIDLGPDNLPVIAHWNTLDHALYLHKLDSDGTWHQQIVDYGPYISGEIGFVIDNQGNYHISYYDGGLGHLKYAFVNDTGKDIYTVDTDGIVGAANSLAVDDNGVPHIAYHDSGRGHLKYAVLHRGAPWYDLELADDNLVPGDLFQLDARAGNPSAQVLTADEYIVLDVFGAYYFYPAWTQSLQSRLVSVEPGTEMHHTVLSFYWPDNAGSAVGLYFYGALFEPSTFDLIDLDSIFWSFTE